MTTLRSDEDILGRMVRAVEKVRERLQRAARALEDANIPYAVIGGNAVAAWVARVDEAAVRNTQDVDLLLRRTDLEAAKDAFPTRDSCFVTSKVSTCSSMVRTRRLATRSISFSRGREFDPKILYRLRRWTSRNRSQPFESSHSNR